jgi:ABC-type polysaccharide/polyol phosphate transport system ATPase subunit
MHALGHGSRCGSKGLGYMSKEHLISVDRLTLRIPAVRNRATSLRANPLSLLVDFYMPRQGKREVRTIIDDLSFEVQDGNRLALIGPNGAGKSTLLRLLAGSVFPTRGTIVTRGKVRALLNVSLGLQGAATGLENIYLRGLSMGFTLAEIRSMVPEIVEFSELGDAIYDSMQTYSAGMRARLSFAIVTARVPNILLMDEWISAGDKHFVEKAQERLEAQISVCRALVLASHSEKVVREICTHGLVLSSGRMIFYGKIDDALNFYDQMKPTNSASRRVN